MFKTRSISNQQLAIVTLAGLVIFLLISGFFLVRSIKRTTQTPPQSETTTSPQQQNVQKALELLAEKTTDTPETPIIKETPQPATEPAQPATQAANPAP